MARNYRATLRKFVPALAVTVCVPAAGSCAHGPNRNPEQSATRAEIAADSFRNNRLEAAVEECQKALELDPENADAYNLLGVVALRRGADHVDQLEVASCLKGVDAEAVRRDATLRFREALEHLRKAVALRPDFAMAWNNLAVAALNLGDWDLAVEAAKSALKDVGYREPQVARANLGWAYFKKKEVQNAWKELHEAVSQAPGFCVGRFRLASVYRERSELVEAAQEIDAVIAQKECPIQEAYLLGGLVHERLKDKGKAREIFARCVELAPRSCIAAECTRYAQLIP